MTDAPVRLPAETVAALIEAVGRAKTDDFVALLKVAALDPGRDLRFCDWSEVDFSGCDLRRFDFTGANLMGCRFQGARIVGARFEAAQVDRTALRVAADWEDYVRTWQAPPKTVGSRHLPDLAVFADAPFAPEMVVIPAGTFLMGSAGEENTKRAKGIEPWRKLKIDYRFAIGRAPVTFEEYDRYCVLTEKTTPNDRGWGRGKRPMINASWEGSQSFVKWLSEITNQLYRLPSEAEWVCACRYGQIKSFSFADDTPPKHAIFLEWVEDLFHVEFDDLPTDGSAYTNEQQSPYRGLHVLRSTLGRSSIAQRGHPPDSYYNHGFRVARTLD